MAKSADSNTQHDLVKITRRKIDMKFARAWKARPSRALQFDECTIDVEALNLLCERSSAQRLWLYDGEVRGDHPFQAPITFLRITSRGERFEGLERLIDGPEVRGISLDCSLSDGAWLPDVLQARDARELALTLRFKHPSVDTACRLLEAGPRNSAFFLYDTMSMGLPSSPSDQPNYSPRDAERTLAALRTQLQLQGLGTSGILSQILADHMDVLHEFKALKEVSLSLSRFEEIKRLIELEHPSLVGLHIDQEYSRQPDRPGQLPWLKGEIHIPAQLESLWLRSLHFGADMRWLGGEGLKELILEFCNHEGDDLRVFAPHHYAGLLYVTNGHREVTGYALAKAFPNASVKGDRQCADNKERYALSRADESLRSRVQNAPAPWDVRTNPMDALFGTESH